MTLEKLDPCCVHAEHQRIYRNEDGWVLTSDFEAWTADEWQAHCDRYTPTKRRKEAEKSRRRYYRRKAA